MPSNFLRLISPVLSPTDSLGDGCFFVICQDDSDPDPDNFGWHFAFIDSEPLDPTAHWHVLAGFPTRKAAEARRRKWLKQEGARPIDDAKTFWCIAELCRLERCRTHKRARRRQKRQAGREAIRRIQREVEVSN